MAIAPRDLLRRLEPAVRPVEGPSPLRLVDEDDDAFAALLASAERGGLESGRPVVAARGLASLDGEGLRRLGRALDVAESLGARSAVLLYRGQGLVASVAERRLERELAAQDPPVGIAVDLVLRVPAADEPLDGPPIPGPFAALVGSDPRMPSGPSERQSLRERPQARGMQE
jgi:hypothetical protein